MQMHTSHVANAENKQGTVATLPGGRNHIKGAAVWVAGSLNKLAAATEKNWLWLTTWIEPALHGEPSFNNRSD